MTAAARRGLFRRLSLSRRNTKHCKHPIGGREHLSMGREPEFMKPQAKAEGNASAVPLLNAVFCTDCETITNSPHDACKVCGSRSLLSLFRVLGGTLRSQRVVVPCANAAKYNLELTAEVNGIPASELHHAIELMTRLAEAADDVKSLHIDVECVLNTELEVRAA